MILTFYTDTYIAARRREANDKAIGHHCTLSQLWLLIPKLLQNGGTVYQHFQKSDLKTITYSCVYGQVQSNRHRGKPKMVL